MSSETSTEPQPAFAPWQLFTLAGLIGATIAVFMARGESPAAVIMISLTIFAAAVVGLAALRTFLPLTQASPADTTHVLGGRTRAALEREKALLLRSIKELEFDRAMGKVSEKDFADMGGRMRARATRLMRQLDAGAGYRNAIDQEIARRVGEPASPATATLPDPVSARDQLDVPDTVSTHDIEERVQVPLSAVACPVCSTANDADARFCKHCGATMEPRD